MNKIDKLLEDLCPEGMEFVKLEEVCEKVSSYQWVGTEERYYIDLSSVNMDNHNILNIQKLFGIYSSFL